MAEQETTTKFKVDISELKKQFADANRQIRLVNSEFKAATAGMDDWGSSADGLGAKIKQLNGVVDAEKSKLQSLEKQYALVAEQQGEGSKGAQELAIKINNQKANVAKAERSLQKYENVLENVSDGSKDVKNASDGAGKGLDDVADSSEKLSVKASGLVGKLADVAKKGLVAITTAATGVVTGFLGTAEATREYREDINKLQTAYQSAGLTAKQAKKTYKDFFSVLGEEDRSVEAVSHLAKLTDSQKDLKKWSNICAGVWGTFGDSLPIEGLTEAANETAKVGQITGPLADAINWCTTDTKKWNEALAGNQKALAAFQKASKGGASAEDSFNAALSACNSEKERSTLITNALNVQYDDAAKKYKQLNGDVMDAQKAQSDLTDAMAAVGAVAEPVMTGVKKVGAQLLTSLVPGVEKLGKGITGIMSGDKDGGKKAGSALSEIITTMLGEIGKSAPKIIQTGVSLVENLAQGAVSAAPSLISSIGKMLPQVTGFASNLLTNIGQGIGNNLPKLTNYALTSLDKFADMLTENAPKLIKAGLSFVQNMAKGLSDSLPTFIKKAPEIITKFANLINDNMPTVLKAAVNIIITLAKGLIKSIPTLVKSIPKIITAFVAVWEAFNWLSLGKKAITFLKDGIVGMIGGIKSAGKSVMEGATSALKELPASLAKFGKNAMTNLKGALGDGISAVKTKAGNVLKSIVDTFKPDSLKKIGKQLIQGLWNGISDMSGWVAGKIKGFNDGVLKGIKKFFGIHSPSRVMRDEVGKMLVLGTAEGIEENKDVLSKSLTNMAQHGLNVLKTALQDGSPESAGTKMINGISKGVEKMTTAAENSVSKVVDAMVKKTKSSKIYSEYKKLGKNAIKAFSDAYEKQAEKAGDKITKAIEKMASKAQGKYEEILSQQNTLQENAQNYGDLYSTDDDGNIILSDIQGQTQDIERFATNLGVLKSRLSKELMNQIAQMDIDEGLAFTNKLLSLPESELRAYDQAYTEKLKVSRKIAKTFYADELKKIKEDFLDKVEEKMKSLKKSMKNVGKNAVAGFIKGFTADTDDMKKAVKQFSQKVIKQIKDEMGIHSPSKVMEQQVGRFLPAGVAKGIRGNAKAAVRAMSEMASQLTLPLKNAMDSVKLDGTLSGSYGSGSTSKNVTNNYTFNQTNNSPKALSRLEIYRQTNNLMETIKRA